MKFDLVCVSKEVSPATSTDIPQIVVNKFNDASVTSFYEHFQKLEADSSVAVIPIIISTYGGEVHALLSMLDIIGASTKPVATIALGKAMSCGAVLLAAGTQGYRYAAPNTSIMIHEVSSMEFGKTSELDNGVKNTKQLNGILFRYLQNRSENLKSRSKNLKDNYFIREMKKRGNTDWYLSATDYKKLGLIDHIGVPKLLKS